jgi:hypothetical protein
MTTTSDVDKAVAALKRRLDRIMACSSGHPNFELVQAKVTKVRAALKQV